MVDLLDRVAADVLAPDPAAGAVQLFGPFNELQPLDAPDAGLPVFPVHCLPRWLDDQVTGVSASLSTPPALAALFGLSVLSTAAAMRVAVAVSDTWIEPIQLYTCTILPPGEGKSPVFTQMIVPVERMEIEMEDGTAAQRIADAEDRKFIEQLLTVKRTAAVRLSGIEQDQARDDIRRLAMKLAELPPPEPPKLRLDDFTPEVVAMAMAANGGRIAVLSDEGGAFSTMAGRYGAGAQNLDIWLKPATGSMIRVDRVGRPSLLIRRTAVTVGIAVQPDVFSRTIEKSAALVGSGLLERFMWAVPITRVGYRDHRNAPAPSPLVQRTYTDRVRALFGIPIREDDDDPRWHLALLSDARELLLQFREWIEPQLRAGGDLDDLVSYANKLAGRAARIAGLLHLATHADARPWKMPIEAATMRDAIEITKWSIPHARAALGLSKSTGEDPYEHERRVLRAIADQPDRIEHKTIDKAARKGGGRRWTAADTRRVIGTLVKFGYLTGPIKRQQGGRPGKIYAINPAWQRPDQS